MRRAVLCLPLAWSFMCIRAGVVIAQTTEPPARVAQFVWNDNRSGPRLGVAYIIGGSVTAEKEGESFSPMTTLFGWQLERQFPTGKQGLPTPVSEFIVLVGGLEQSRVLPSASWLFGLRQPNGWEAGIGPTATVTGVQLSLAAGVTHSFGALNVPVNLAVSPGRRGASIGLTTGFNTQR